VVRGSSSPAFVSVHPASSTARPRPSRALLVLSRSWPWLSRRLFRSADSAV
jgi:hypothetical protein